MSAHPAENDAGVTVRPAESCPASPDLGSQWRNGPHWHAVWPEGADWCYPTEQAAQERAAEVNGMRATSVLRRACMNTLAGRSVDSFIDPRAVLSLLVDVADLRDELAAVAADRRANGLRQVWCVAYDSDTPQMDGTHPPLRMADQSREQAERNLEVIQSRSTRSPKRNLRIETRFVTDYTTVQ